MSHSAKTSANLQCCQSISHRFIKWEDIAEPTSLSEPSHWFLIAIYWANNSLFQPILCYCCFALKCALSSSSGSQTQSSGLSRSVGYPAIPAKGQMSMEKWTDVSQLLTGWTQQSRTGTSEKQAVCPSLRTTARSDLAPFSLDCEQKVPYCVIVEIYAPNNPTCLIKMV